MEREEVLMDIRKTVVLKAPIEDVWDLISTSEGLASWLMNNTFKPMIGNEFILEAGGFGDSPCVVTNFDPIKCVAFTWGKDWKLIFEIEKIDDEKTVFTLIHSGWDAKKLTEFKQPHEVVRTIMDNSWDHFIDEKINEALKQKKNL